MYFVLNNNTCKWLDLYQHWIIDLPREFVDSTSKNKSIKILNFIHEEAYTSLHSPTLCDGNFHQDDYYITTYNPYHVVNKVYPINSHCEYIEFYFNDLNSKGNFVIELELIF